MQALDSAVNNILAGRSQLVLAGGVDALSRAPLLYADAMVLWFAEMAQARTAGQRARSSRAAVQGSARTGASGS
jgi:acetyl-CoA C-acetyltransferase